MDRRRFVAPERSPASRRDRDPHPPEERQLVPRAPVAPPREPDAPPPDRERREVRINPATRRLRFAGRNLIGRGGPPEIRLAGRPLALDVAEQDLVVARLPETAEMREILQGRSDAELEVRFSDGSSDTLQLAVDGASAEGSDPWSPGRSGGK